MEEKFEHEVINRCPLTGEQCGCYEGREACSFTQDYTLKSYAEMFNKIFPKSR